MNYNTIKRNYQRGLWDISAVELAYAKGVITAEQFKEITGEDAPEIIEKPAEPANSSEAMDLLNILLGGSNE